MRHVLILTLTLVAAPAFADAPLFLLDQTQLPFDLGPGDPQNSPARQSNSPNAAANSQARPANRSSTYANSPANPANEKRVIITPDGDIVGFYTPNGSGTLNLFDVNGKRVAYRPKASKSLFSNRGKWCGTVADSNGGGYAFGMIRECVSLF
ncbi:MAG: hypothetical protein ACK5NN_03745 [Sphingomonadaceae bacterium]